MQDQDVKELVSILNSWFIDKFGDPFILELSPHKRHNDETVVESVAVAIAYERHRGNGYMRFTTQLGHFDEHVFHYDDKTIDLANPRFFETMAELIAPKIVKMLGDMIFFDKSESGKSLDHASKYLINFHKGYRLSCPLAGDKGLFIEPLNESGS